MTRTEETLLDEPVTPAPVFAYRALRGLFFGSPDPNSSPARVLQHEDKENVLPQCLGVITEEIEKGSYAPKPSPQKRKIANDMVSLSPSKSLAVPLSPTKGILRTPGVATPRAKALRDTNVKFRSLSPEVRRKEIKHELVLGELREDGRDAKTITKKSHTVNESIIKPELQSRPSVATVTATQTLSKPDFDFEGYQRRTEKEMKMLIRQGQKWREYAKLQDYENTKLRQRLEQAEKENERLQRKLRLMERERQSSNAESAARTALQPSKGHEDDDRASKKAKTASTDPASFTGRSISDSLETRLSQLRHSSAPSLTNHTLGARSLRLLLSDVHPENPSTKTPAPNPSAPSPLTTLAQQLEPSPSPSTSTRTNLAPERYSAARQRIRHRQQARRASALSQVVEESGVDWAGLG